MDIGPRDIGGGGEEVIPTSSVERYVLTHLGLGFFETLFQISELNMDYIFISIFVFLP